MKVKVKYKDILHRTEKAALFLVKGERTVWLPCRAFRFGCGRTLVVDKSLAEAKGLEHKPYCHAPAPIEPEFGQEALEELTYGHK